MRSSRCQWDSTRVSIVVYPFLPAVGRQVAKFSPIGTLIPIGPLWGRLGRLLLCLSVQPSRVDRSAATELNREGFHVWLLKKAAVAGQLEVVPFVNQTRREDSSDVIVLPLDVIWDARTFEIIIQTWKVILEKEKKRTHQAMVAESVPRVPPRRR